MFAKHKKSVSVVVLVAFFWMLQVSALPLHAGAGAAPRHDMSASAQEVPGAVENETQPVVVGKSGSILPYILIGVGALAVAAVLVFVVFKTSYDITGNWVVNHTITTFTYHMHFIGSKSAGTVTMDTLLDAGAYTVDGKNVTFYGEYTGGGWNHIYTYTGTFSDKNTMSGTVIHLDRNSGISINGTWIATRE